MRPRTPITLVGLRSRLIDAKGQCVFEGIVLRESDKMIHLLTESGVRKLPKDRFTVIVESGDAKLEASGILLKGRPVQRLKRQKHVWARP